MPSMILSLYMESQGISYVLLYSIYELVSPLLTYLRSSHPSTSFALHLVFFTIPLCRCHWYTLE